MVSSFVNRSIGCRSQRNGPEARWVASATVQAETLELAVLEALDALGDLTGAGLVIAAFETLGGVEHAAKLLHQQLQGVDSIGMRTDQLVRDGAASLHTAAVELMVLGGSEFSTAIGWQHCANSHDSRLAGRSASACADSITPLGHDLIVMFVAGQTDPQAAIRGAYDCVGAGIAMVGGCATAPQGHDGTAVFANGTALADGCVVAALSTSSRFGVGVAHGWSPVGDPLLVGECEEWTVTTMADEPALTAYLRVFGYSSSDFHSTADILDFALTHPVGIVARSGIETRSIVDVDVSQGTFRCAAPVHPGGVLWPLKGSAHTVLGAVEVAVVDGIAAAGSSEVLGAMAFDCVARRAVLGETAERQELESLRRHLGAVPMLGLYTHGEIAKLGGARGFHNQTIVALVLT